MITVIAHYTAAASAADAVRQLLARHAAAARAEPGCLQFDAHQGIDSPDEFAVTPPRTCSPLAVAIDLAELT